MESGLLFKHNAGVPQRCHVMKVPHSLPLGSDEPWKTTRSVYVFASHSCSFGRVYVNEDLLEQVLEACHIIDDVRNVNSSYLILVT
jgi:hypothetical protein